MRTTTLTNRVTINRLGAVEGSAHKTGRTALATGVRCLILPSDYRAAAARNLALNQAYDIFFNSTQDVKVGDEIVDETSRKFKVSGIRPQPGIYSAHKQVLAELQVGN